MMALETTPDITGSILKFTGRNRQEAKRKALNFWYTHQETLHESMRDFIKHCTLSSDQKVITYRRHSTQ